MKSSFDKARFIRVLHEKVARAKAYPGCEWMQADAQAAAATLKMIESGEIKLGAK